MNIKYIIVASLTTSIMGLAMAGYENGASQLPTVAFTIKSKNTLKLRFAGRLDFQYDSVRSTGVPTTNRFYFRRLRLGVKATLNNNTTAVFDYEFGSNIVNKAYISFKYAGGKMKIGYAKVAFGYLDAISSAKLPAIERSVATRYFISEIDFSLRHSGIQYATKLAGGFSYRLVLVNSQVGISSRSSGDGSNRLAYYGSLRWKRGNFLVGCDYGYQPDNDAISANVSAWTVYTNYKWDKFVFTGEYFDANASSNNDAECMTGQVVYNHDSNWQLVYRFSCVDAEQAFSATDNVIWRAFRGASVNSEVISHYIGVNYQFDKSTRLMVGYEIAKSQGTNPEMDIDGIRARLQLLF